jgi:hypothetical protein
LSFSLTWIATGEENVVFYARVKGMSEHSANRLVDCVFHHFDMKDLRKQLVKNYSAGNQRKLSYVVACIGSPSVVFLGEGVVRVSSLIVSPIVVCFQMNRVVVWYVRANCMKFVFSELFQLQSQDPIARRRMWEVTQALTVNRTLLLTTHMLEEVCRLMIYVLVKELVIFKRFVCCGEGGTALLTDCNHG